MGKDHEMITAAEFERFTRGMDTRLDERFQAAQVRLADLRQFISEGFETIRRRLDVSNGRLASNEKATEQIRDEGCAVMERHLAAMKPPPSTTTTSTTTTTKSGATVNLALNRKQLLAVVLGLLLIGALFAGRQEAWVLVEKLFGK